MGSEDGRADELPRHRVRLDPFYIDETPITYRAYRPYLAAGAERPAYWRYDSYNRPAQPVTGLTWFDAACYCNWRSAREGRRPAYVATDRRDAWGYPVWRLRSERDARSGYRLPTEAEFEYAARGGLADRSFPWGDRLDPAWANFDEGRGVRRGRWWRLSRVKDQRPNAYGLYGMSGNVWEWTGDWYGSYRGAWFGARENPQGRRSGRRRVIRGGSWGSHRVEDLRVARRSYSAPGFYNYDIGFRCVLPAAAEDGSENAADAPATAGPVAVDLAQVCPDARPAAPPGSDDREAETPAPEDSKIDGAFRKRLARYIADRFPESVYFHERVDEQEILTPETMAELIVDATTKYEIHPLFLTGIMVSESGFGTVSFPRWFNNPMAYHWGNWKMRYGLPYYEPRKYRNRRYRDLRAAFEIFSRGIRRRIYTEAARGDLNRFHLVYVGYEAREWMNSLSGVYRDVGGLDFAAHSPAEESGRFIYLDWDEIR